MCREPNSQVGQDLASTRPICMKRQRSSDDEGASHLVIPSRNSGLLQCRKPWPSGIEVDAA